MIDIRRIKSASKKAEILKEFFNPDNAVSAEPTPTKELEKIYKGENRLERKVPPFNYYRKGKINGFNMFARCINKENLSYFDIEYMSKEFQMSTTKRDDFKLRDKYHYCAYFDVNEDGSYYAYSIRRELNPQAGYFDWYLVGEIPIKPANRIYVDFFTNKIVKVELIKKSLIKLLWLKLKLRLLGFKKAGPSPL